MKTATLKPETTIYTGDVNYAERVDWNIAVGLVRGNKALAQNFVECDALIAEAYPAEAKQAKPKDDK